MPDTSFAVRSLRKGDWYWIDKRLLKQYASKIKPIGVAVYNILASMVDESQYCFPSHAYIANLLGYSRSTITRTIKLLESQGLISCERQEGTHSVYHLLDLGCSTRAPDLLHSRTEPVSPMHPNNTTLTRINNNRNMRKKKNSPDSSFKEIKLKTREELLAMDLSEILHDHAHYSYYLKSAERYPEELLRRLASEVNELPAYRIKKSRGAFFTYLLNKHAEQQHNFRY